MDYLSLLALQQRTMCTIDGHTHTCRSAPLCFSLWAPLTVYFMDSVCVCVCESRHPGASRPLLWPRSPSPVLSDHRHTRRTHQQTSIDAHACCDPFPELKHNRCCQSGKTRQHSKVLFCFLEGVWDQRPDDFLLIYKVTQECLKFYFPPADYITSLFQIVCKDVVKNASREIYFTSGFIQGFCTKLY